MTALRSILVERARRACGRTRVSYSAAAAARLVSSSARASYMVSAAATARLLCFSAAAADGLRGAAPRRRLPRTLLRTVAAFGLEAGAGCL